jgi:hypothetical protein
LAPGTVAAVSSPAAAGITGSALPCTTSVGTVIVFRSSTRLPEAMIATYWRALPAG